MPGNRARLPGDARGQRGRWAGSQLAVGCCWLPAAKSQVARTGASGTRATGHTTPGFVKAFKINLVLWLNEVTALGHGQAIP